MDQEKTLSERLDFLANKLQNMWGRNPDTDLIREAAKALQEPEPETQSDPKPKTRRTAKKDAE